MLKVRKLDLFYILISTILLLFFSNSLKAEEIVDEEIDDIVYRTYKIALELDASLMYNYISEEFELLFEISFEIDNGILKKWEILNIDSLRELGLSGCCRVIDARLFFPTLYYGFKNKNVICYHKIKIVKYSPFEVVVLGGKISYTNDPFTNKIIHGDEYGIQIDNEYVELNLEKLRDKYENELSELDSNILESIRSMASGTLSMFHVDRLKKLDLITVFKSFKYYFNEVLKYRAIRLKKECYKNFYNFFINTHYKEKYLDILRFELTKYPNTDHYNLEYLDDIRDILEQNGDENE